MLNIGILFLILVLLPICLGIFVEALKKGKEKTFAYLWTRGLAWEWGVFSATYLIAQTVTDYHFRVHWICFLVLCAILGVAGVAAVYFKKRKVFSLKMGNDKLKLLEIGVKAAMFAMVLFLCWENINQSQFLSDDITIETMNTVLENDTTGKYDPWTGREYTDGQEASREPLLVIFWTGLSWSLGMHPAELLNSYLAPLFILLFYMLCLEAGRQLFGKKGIKAEMFVIGIMLLHVFSAARQWLPFYQLENGPWIPAHILSWFLLPMLTLEIFKWLQLKKKTYQTVHCIALSCTVAVLAESGWFYVLVLLLLGGAVYLGRELWKC